MSNSVNNPEQLLQAIGAILRTELDLEEDQTVLMNQAFTMPKNKRLYIAVGLMGGKTFGAKTKYVNDPVSNELVQVQGLNRQEMVSIHAYSKGEEALQRNWEIPVALNSIVSQQSQEASSFNLAKIPVAMVDISSQDGARRLFRYALTFMAQVAYRKTSNAQFFDSFQQPQIVTNQ